MNYYQPKELADEAGKPTGVWHYTCTNDHKTWPTGYCAQGCTGHATPDEAREHYRQYLLDTADFDGRLGQSSTSRTERKCEADGCDVWTDRFASVGPGRMEMHFLCDQHRNRENLDPLVIAGDVTSSY